MELQDTKTITLRKPITVGEQTVTEITLREPTAEEIGRAQDKATNNTFATINLVAIVGGLACGCREALAARFHGGGELPRTFYRGLPTNWRSVVADLTKFYGWGPKDAWGEPVSRLMWWFKEAQRMTNGE